MTWQSGQPLAKSIGYQQPSRRSASQELKSQPKKLLMVSVMSWSSEASSSPKEIALEPVAVVQRLRRIVVHDADLRPEADAANEELVGEDALLQVHDELAAVLVGVAQLLLVVDPADADPAAAGCRAS